MPGVPAIDPQLAALCTLVEEVALRRRWRGRTFRRRLDVLAMPMTGRPSPVAAQYSSAFARTVADVASRWQPYVIQIVHDVTAYCAPTVRGVAPVTTLWCLEPGLLAARDLVAASSRGASG